MLKCDSGIAVYDTDIDQISKFIYDKEELLLIRKQIKRFLKMEENGEA